MLDWRPRLRLGVGRKKRKPQPKPTQQMSMSSILLHPLRHGHAAILINQHKFFLTIEKRKVHLIGKVNNFKLFKLFLNHTS